MMGKRISFAGLFTILIAIHCVHAENAHSSNVNSFLLPLNDTLLPVSIISSDKMNIMIDVQKELIALQWKGLNKEDRIVLLTDSSGKIYDQKQMYAGSTIVYFETQTLYEGNYILKIWDQPELIYKKIKLIKPE